MELLEYLRQLPGKKVTVFLDNNVIRISSGDSEMIFSANIDNYAILFNIGLLGGEVIIQNASPIIINQRPHQFQSGKEYTITCINFYTDMLGETTVKFDETFYWLSIELESEDHEFCDISMDSDIITLTEKKNQS